MRSRFLTYFSLHKMSRIDTIATFFLLFFIIYEVSARSCFLSHYHVYLTNKIPNSAPITHHCRSKDDDLGLRTLYNNQTSDIEFCGAIHGRTLFWCHITWNKNSLSFDIFNSRISLLFCSDKCTWVMKPDGIYVLNSKDRDLGMAYYWNGTLAPHSPVIPPNSTHTL